MGYGDTQRNSDIVMKKTTFILLMMLAINAYAAPVWVAVKKSVVRKSPTNLSAVVVKVNYQDQLELLSEKGDWWQVKFENSEGWMHKSALSKSLETAGEKQQQSSGGGLMSLLKGGSSSTQSQHDSSGQRGGDADDVTLAGKGFNEDVEGEFKKQGSELNYAAVDIMENREVPTYDFQKFAEEGGLDYVIKQAEAKQEKKSWGGFSLPGGLFE
jgi:uncharacterized protein YgiM (DUF1202 family)